MITLYSTNCPKCKILGKKLDEKKIKYEVITDKDIMINKGFMSAPVLEVDGEMLDFGKAVRWVNNYTVGE